MGPSLIFKLIIIATVIILIGCSVFSWAIILYKIFQFKKFRPVATSRDLSASFNLKDEYILSKYLLSLATIGSVSPYIGLFGTVLGIMHALLALSQNAQNLGLIIPGIAEALITTALGLFAAIPAIIAYNHLLRWKDKLLNSVQTS